MILRKAYMDELNAAYQCIEDAREYHASLGFLQWRAEYPTVRTIEEDIESGNGFVFLDGDELVGYCCILIGDDPAYHIIDGLWKTDREYAAIHRMAFAKKNIGKSRSAEAFALIRDFCGENGIDALRVDTQEENKVMQHILAREGFAYCGLVEFNGGPKLAYEWDR